ncbi:hypothetical protein GGR55DRAFT_635420 [Xylaria sp. FL0064]|nr:hypothetical protein GGR55DRAFT_635420 [Xylaria sp. FL0064]
MREYSWHAVDNQPVQAAIRLKEVCDDPEHVNGHDHYQHILGLGLESRDFLGEKIFEYVQKDERLKSCLPDDFLPKFTMLVAILRESHTKRLRDVARTDLYPQ